MLISEKSHTRHGTEYYLLQVILAASRLRLRMYVKLVEYRTDILTTAV